MIDASTETTPLTREERQLRLLMGICAVAFAGTGLSFFIAPVPVCTLLQRIGSLVGFEHCMGMSSGPWVPLSVSMMTMITVICVLAWRDVRRYRILIPILLVSKAASSLAGVGRYLAVSQFQDLVVFITDFPIFLLCAVMYWRAAPRR